jgi:hypothetical protein
MANDHRALPDIVLNLYLYPVGAWVILFAGLYFAGYAFFAIPLCYPLALWQIGLSMGWGRWLLKRLRSGELTTAEAHAGVRSVGQLLAWSALTPAMVFLTNDPLAPTAWSTTLGAVAISAATYFGVLFLSRWASYWTHGVAIALACFALPLNATGAVTMATMVGLYDVVIHQSPVPMPEVMHPHRKDDGHGHKE